MRAIEFLERISVIEMRMLAHWLFVSLVLSSVLLGNQPGIPEELKGLVTEGIDLTLKQDYGRADSVFRVAIVRFPHNPLGYLYRAAVMQTISMDYLDPLNFDAFDSLLSTAKSEANKIVDEYPQSSIGYYLLGTAEGFDAYSRVDAGNWVVGIAKGLGAASDFKKAVELDSTYYDAYVGVGTYYYWKSRKTEFLNWALGDRRSEGIRLLELAVLRAEHNRFAALSALTAIYTDCGKFDRAIECAMLGLQKYPDNRIFLWGLAAAQEQSGKFAEAVETYRHLLKNIIDARISNPYNEILCRLNLVKNSLAMKETEGLEQQIEAIMAFEHHMFPENLTKRALDKFKQARNIQSRLIVE